MPTVTATEHMIVTLEKNISCYSSRRSQRDEIDLRNALLSSSLINQRFQQLLANIGSRITRTYLHQTMGELWINSYTEKSQIGMK